MGLTSAVHDMARAALDLVAPGRCAGCGLHVSTPLCESCARPLHGADPIARWISTPAGNLPVFAAARYEGSVRAALIGYKERGRRDVGADLASALTRAAVTAAASGLLASSGLLTPVPSGRDAVRERGYDAVALLASRAARQLRRMGFDVASAPVLRQARPVSDQAGLPVSQRRSNLSGALAVSAQRDRDLVAGRVVLVVDDIVTSGATAIEACRALGEVGAIVVAVVAVAGTPKESPRSEKGPISGSLGRLDGANGCAIGLG